MPDVTASYGMYLDFNPFFTNFAHNCRPFMSKVLYLHQTFMDCVSNQYKHFDIFISQM